MKFGTHDAAPGKTRHPDSTRAWVDVGGACALLFSYMWRKNAGFDLKAKLCKASATQAALLEKPEIELDPWYLP